MSKVITIPNCQDPFIVIVNGEEYRYTPGETVEVPDHVAEVIENHMELQPPEPAPAPEGGCGVSSWNDLTDKPFGEETVETVYLKETYVGEDAYSTDINGHPSTMIVGDEDIPWGQDVLLNIEINGVTVTYTAGYGYIDYNFPEAGGALYLAGNAKNLEFRFCVYGDINTVIPCTVKIYTVETETKTLDPKYLPEQLQIGEENVVQVIQEEAEVAHGGNLSSALINDYIGKTATVVCDGTVYEREVLFYESTGKINIGVMGDGDPFNISAYPGKNPVVYYKDMNGHTLSVSIPATIVHTLDAKFLPEQLRIESFVKNIVDNLIVLQYGGQKLGNFSLVAGDTYKTTYDGVEYTCKAITGSDGHIYFGNMSASYIGGDDTGEPFCVGTEAYGEVYIFHKEEKYEHRILVSIDHIGVTTLDSKYLPKAAAVADVTDAPTAEQFNSLLASLRAAGYMA